MHRSEIAPNAHNLERFQPILILMEVGTFLVGCLIWVEAWTGDGTAFRPSTWGLAAWNASAEFWAAAIMGASALTIIGLMQPPKRWMVSVGALAHCVVLSGLGLSAALSGGDMAVAVFAFTALLPLHAWTFVSNRKR